MDKAKLKALLEDVRAKIETSISGLDDESIPLNEQLNYLAGIQTDVQNVRDLMHASAAATDANDEIRPKAFKPGDIVTFAPGRCDDAEKGSLHMVLEWNGDRGYIRPVHTTMAIIPHELVRDADIVKQENAAAIFDQRGNLTGVRLD